MPYYVYIVMCRDQTLYTGITNDLDKRIFIHNQGKGAKYTRGRRPVRLVYYEAYGDRSLASQREWEIKQMDRLQKDNLIQGGRSNNGDTRE